MADLVAAFELHLDAPQARDPMAELLQPSAHAGLVGGRGPRPQLLHEEPELALLVDQQPLDLLEPGARRVGIGPHRPAQAADMKGGGCQRLRDAVVQLARHPDALLIGGRVPRLDHQEVLLEHAHDLTAEDEADHEIVGGELRLVEREQARGHSLADDRHREHVAGPDAARELGVERLSAPGEQSLLRGAHRGGRLDRQIETEESGVAQGLGDQGRQRSGVVPFMHQLAVVPHQGVEPGLLGVFPGQQHARSAQDRGGMGEGVAGRLLELAVTLAGKVGEPHQPAPQLSFPGAEEPQQHRHQREIGSADDDAVELEVGNATETEEAEQDVGDDDGGAGHRDAAPLPT
jgi:hypothetical protein